MISKASKILEMTAVDDTTVKYKKPSRGDRGYYDEPWEGEVIELDKFAKKETGGKEGIVLGRNKNMKVIAKTDNEKTILVSFPGKTLFRPSAKVTALKREGFWKDFDQKIQDKYNGSFAKEVKK